MSSFSAIYERIPKFVEGKERELGLVASVPNDYVQSFLKRRLPTQKHKRDDALITGQRDYYVLDVIKKSTAVSAPGSEGQKSKLTKRNKRLTSKEKRMLRSRDHMKKEVTSYEAYIPLQKLWLEYFRRVVDLKFAQKAESQNYAQIHVQLLKADYHGCKMTISKSKCPSHIGSSGIVLMETRNVFKFVTKENRLLTIPKENNVFTFVVDGLVFTLHGNHFRVKSSERAVRRFKTRATHSL